MRKLLLYVCFGLLICCLSCKKEDPLLTFTISNTSSLIIPSSAGIKLPITISTPGIATNSSQVFSKNNTAANYVENIYIKNIQLTITNPSKQTFNFLRSIDIYISTDSSNEIALAHLDSIPTNATSITLVPTSAALDLYIKSSRYNLRTVLVINQDLSQDITVIADSKFQVTAQPMVPDM